MSDSAEQPFHITSFVVRCQPENLHKVMTSVGSMAGVEIHGHDPRGRFVALLEMDSEQALMDTITAIELTGGVINASMVYHHAE